MNFCFLDTSAAADNGTSDGKTYNIGIVQLVQHDALDAATQGFMDTLTEKLGDSVKFDLQNANGESTNCSTIATGFVASNVDLILANATAALQASGAATSNIPILGTSVTDYATALEIDDWTGVTGRNISGTSDLAPIDEQEEMLKELFPEVKQVGIIYCSAEANSKYQATLSISYYDLGCKTGEMAYEILVNGADPATMEIAFAPNVTKKYNAQICSDLGITPPEGYVAIDAE